jgi:hypothetical protein
MHIEMADHAPRLGIFLFRPPPPALVSGPLCQSLEKVPELCQGEMRPWTEVKTRSVTNEPPCLFEPEEEGVCASLAVCVCDSVSTQTSPSPSDP